MSAEEGRLPPTPNRYPQPHMSDIRWERVVTVLRRSSARGDHLLADNLDRQLQGLRQRWANRERTNP